MAGNRPKLGASISRDRGRTKGKHVRVWMGADVHLDAYAWTWAGAERKLAKLKKRALRIWAEGEVDDW